MQSLFRVKTRILLALSTLVFLVGSFSAFAKDFETTAKYAYMLDYNTGTVLFEKNADEQMEPSSMTKIMTAYLVFDALKRGDVTLDTKFHISEKAWRKGGSKMFVKEGDDVSLDDLLHGIIVQSGNDACIVVAEGFAGSETAFADDMNFMAKKLGMTGSHFRNSTGWPDIEHLTTARDLVTLAKHTIDDFPEYFHYYSILSFTYNKIKQPNRNYLLTRNIGADGFKTGYTERAGYGIVATAVQEGRRIVLAINGLTSSKARINEAERLLRHGFRDFNNISLYKSGDTVENAEVWFGDKDEVPLVTKEDVEMTVSRRVSQRPDIELAVSYNDPIPAPIAIGQRVADLTIKKDGKVVRVVPLHAGREIDKISFFGRLMAKIKHVAGF